MKRAKRAPGRKRRLAAKRAAASPRLAFRRVSTGEGFLPWVRELRKSSGVYVIRSASTKRVLYVGESHSGRLYDTLTRHFREWSGEKAGTTYHRTRVEVAVRTMPRSLSFRSQVDLIRRLRPKDNTHHLPARASARKPDDWLDFLD